MSRDAGTRHVMSDTIPAIEQGGVVISPEHVRELRVLLGEVRKQQYAPATCGHNNNAAVELPGPLRALLAPEPTPQATRRPDHTPPRPRPGREPTPQPPRRRDHPPPRPRLPA